MLKPLYQIKGIGPLSKAEREVLESAGFSISLSPYSTVVNESTAFDQPVCISLNAGAEAVKAVFDLSLVGPDSGFKAEDVAKACAKAWGLKYVD